MSPVLFIGAAVTAYLVAAALIKSARAPQSQFPVQGPSAGSAAAAANLAASGGYYVNV